MAYYRIGDALSRKALWNHAMAPLEKAIWLNPDFSSPYVLFGKAYYRLGQLPFAEGSIGRYIWIPTMQARTTSLLTCTAMWDEGGRSGGIANLEKAEGAEGKMTKRNFGELFGFRKGNLNGILK